MPRIVTEKELNTYLDNGAIIKDGDKKCVEGIKYDFRLGSTFLKSYFGRPVEYDKLDYAGKAKAIVEPGEVVFVKTMERISLPKNMYVQLSHKRKIGHEGIQLLGGTTIDPGYEGYLFFGMMNIAGTSFPLEPGKKLIGATFFELTEDEAIDDDAIIPASLEDFPENLQLLVQKYQPVNPQSIKEELEKLSKHVQQEQNGLKDDVRHLSNKLDSVQREQNGLRDAVNKLQVDSSIHSKSIEKLQTAVENSSTNLSSQFKESTDSLSEKIDTIDQRIKTYSAWIKVLAWVVGIGAAVLSGVMTGFFNKLLGLA